MRRLHQAATLAHDTASDFVQGVVLPCLAPTAVLAVLAALFVGPLWILARTLGVC